MKANVLVFIQRPKAAGRLVQGGDGVKNWLVLNVTITKTSTGDQDYIQIMSADMVSVNVVLVADQIEVKDHRSPGKKK